MNNTVEFILKLKDMMSGGMRNVAATAQSAMSRVEAVVSRTGRNTTRSIGDINKQLDKLRATRELSIDLRQIRTANREINKLEAQRDKLEGGKGDKKGRSGGMAAGLLRFGPAALALAAGAGMMGIVKQGAHAEQDIVGLRTFVGANRANQVYANIQKDAAVSPYTTQSLMMVNRALISTGMDADKARKDTNNLANAIAAVGGGNDELGRMAVNMAQIKNQGKATAMDIRQFAMAGINIYGLLAEATGKPIEKVKDMEASYDLLSFALNKAAQKGGMYAGALEAQGKTMTGKWSTFIDNIQIGAAKIGLALEPAVNKLLDMAIKATNAMPDVLTKIQPVLTIVANAVSQVIGLIPVVMQVFQPFGDLLSHMPIAALITDVVNFAKEIANTLGPVVQNLIPLFAAVMDVGNDLVKRVFSVLTPILHTLGPLLADVAHALSSLLVPALRIVGAVVGKVVDIVAGFVSKLLWLIKPIVYLATIVGEAIGSMLDTVADVVSTKQPAITKSIESIVDAQDLNKTFEDAGAKHGYSYANAMAQSINETLSEKFKTVGQNEALKSFQMTSKQQAAAYIKSGKVVDDNSTSPKLQAATILETLPDALKQAGTTMGKEAFESLAIQAQQQAGTLKKAFGIDIGGKVGSIVTTQRNALVAMANQVSKGPGVYTGKTGEDDDSKAKKINGGGVRAINITIGKFWDDIVFNVNSTKEAVAKTGDQVAEGIARLLHSANEMQ